MSSGFTAVFTALLVVQGVATLILLGRLSHGRRLPRPLEPLPAGSAGGRTTIVVPTLNEAARITPLLGALRALSAPVTEIIFVDSGSTDGTAELLAAAAASDDRVRVLSDPPLPAGWIGKAWALQHGVREARGVWVLELDADIQPRPGLAAAVVDVAEREGYDVASFSPRFASQSAMERWLQPSLLASLVYRTGPGGGNLSANAVLANGQCFLVRRDVLLKHGGYEPVRASFAEDVSLARHLARRGARVAFLDGSRLFDVRAYGSATEMWREWGRSIDLKDATPRVRQIADVAFVLLVQGAPVPLLLAYAIGAPIPAALALLNGMIGVVRALLGVAMAGSYEKRGIAYWLSPLSDPLAALRVLMSSLRRPTAWRGRNY